MSSGLGNSCADSAHFPTIPLADDCSVAFSNGEAEGVRIVMLRGVAALHLFTELASSSAEDSPLRC
jgi:hypothetical protein